MHPAEQVEAALVARVLEAWLLTEKTRPLPEVEAEALGE